MKLMIDTDANTLLIEEGGQQSDMILYSKEAFEKISDLWVKVGWNEKYPYTFSWMGRPVIQLPEDMIRMQEVIYEIQPDVIIETGVAHGGSLIYYASLLKAMGRESSRVIGIDIEIRPHNREAIEAHELFPYITLIEGSSIDQSIIDKVHGYVETGQKVLVILDSCHSKEHVLQELRAYHDLVSINSYIVATDGVMMNVFDVPRGEKHWDVDNPTFAAKEFIEEVDGFIVEQPSWPFNESELSENVTHYPGAWLKRIK